ncbi:uncharacterized protein PD653_5025 [Nocardioides sp. PD653]|nr:uncharacterized protein PD653B2_2938 [Nocardioides sp. PD653-B2]GAW57580.1 uncharacterized protein PD653_5025 [Nocardioides sp. PD653]
MLRVLGIELMHLEVATDDDQPDDKARDLSGGTTSSTTVGFEIRPPAPLEVEIPDR